MRAIFYTRHGMTRWVRYLAEHTAWLSETLIVSELRNEGEVTLADAFYRAMRGGGSAQEPLRQFGPDACADIIARCRVLRALPEDQAMAMIGAITIAWSELLDRFKPDLFIATRVDSYVLDVLDRLLVARDIPYVGWWRAAVTPKMIFFTRRGEHIPVREPADEEIEAFIARVAADEFRATSLRNGARFDAPAFVRKRLYYIFRDAYLAVESVLRRDRLGYRYLASSRTVPEYQVRFRDWTLVRRLRTTWEAAFNETPFEKRVFVGLQVNPESTIDYYVKDVRLLHCRTVLQALVDAFAPRGYRIFIKDHPNMFGMRRADFFDGFLRSGAVVPVPYDVPSPPLVDQSLTTFTWSGTVGLQSAMRGHRPIVVEPPYLVDGPFVQLKTFDDIAKLPARAEAHRNPMTLVESQRAIARHVLSACVPGTLAYAGFNERDPRKAAEADRLMESVRAFLPQVIAQQP
jgi:hypothetical protein